MHQGWYEDPKYQKVLPKIAVVVTFFQTKRAYGHFNEDKVHTLCVNLLAHAKFKPGVDYDLIIVNHGPGPIPIPTKKSIIKLDAPNFGYSFGGWKQAWDHFKDRYDFYLFTEDDIAPSKDGWLLEILTRFMSDRTIGAVGNFVECRSINESGSDQIFSVAGTSRDKMYNFDGAFTFTSSKILKQVDDIGGLIVADCAPNTSIPGTVNEAVFQERILELGYKIDSFSDGNYFVVHGSEIFTNDVALRSGPFCPLMNLNGRHKVPELKQLYESIIDTNI